METGSSWSDASLRAGLGRPVSGRLVFGFVWVCVGVCVFFPLSLCLSSLEDPSSCCRDGSCKMFVVMHRRREAQDLTRILCQWCVCAPLLSQADRSRYPDRQLGHGGRRRDVMHHPRRAAAVPEGLGSGWRQLRSGPRGKQKPERENCDGKLTREAGPALGTEIHGEGGVGGSRVEGGFVVCATRSPMSVVL